jgi:hypothetical protein
MADIANFLAQNSPRFNRAAQDRSHFGNALLQNDVDRLPQRNAAEDAAIAADQQAVGQDRQTHARKMAADMLGAIADAPPERRLQLATQIVRGSAFQQVGRDAGLPVDQFNPQPTDDPEQLGQISRSWAQALGQGSGQQARVQSTQVLEDGTIAYVTSDGQLVRTGEKARNPLQFATDVGGGVPGFANRQSGKVTPVSTPEVENQAAADRAQATAAAQARGDAQGGTKPVRLQAALRRLDRVKTASEKLSFGGPIIGGVVGMTPEGQELDQANAQLLTELTALTRVPGVGAQSDLEQRLAQLQLPTAGMYPAVRANAIKELEQFLGDLEAALTNVGGQGAPSANSGGWTITEVK